MQENGSEVLRRELSTLRTDQQAVCTLVQVEFHSALSRRERRGEIDVAVSRLLQDSFQAHYAALIHWEVDDHLLRAAVELLKRHDLRSLDALQLAAALHFHSYLLRSDRLLFIASDLRLLTAARAEGIATWDPATQPPPVN